MSGSMKTLKSAMKAAEQRAAADEAGVRSAERRSRWWRRGRGALVALQVFLVIAAWGGLAGLIWYQNAIEQGPVRGWPASLAKALGLPSHETRTIRLGGLILRPETLDIQILFAPGSADLSPQARRDLANLGLALKGPTYRGRRIQIIGHADPVGNAAKNLELSAKRARRVRDFLIRESGLPASRLQTLSKGEGAPADAARPNAPHNRRVEIVLAGLAE